jgi:hypothetical protein
MNDTVIVRCRWCGGKIAPDPLYGGKWYHTWYYRNGKYLSYKYWCYDSRGVQRTPKPAEVRE